MKKKCLSILCLLLLFVSVALPVHAVGSSPRLVDNADYLTDSEEATLLNKLDEISARQGLDIVIVTIPDLYGEDITAFADDFYDENGYQPDGILLLISVGIGLFAALIVTGSMKGKLKTVHAQAAASQYVKPGSMNITERREMFLYSQIQRHKRETKASGGSSTHTSSSGRTHGGSSGKF